MATLFATSKAEFWSVGRRENKEPAVLFVKAVPGRCTIHPPAREMGAQLGSNRAVLLQLRDFIEEAGENGPRGRLQPLLQDLSRFSPELLNTCPDTIC